MAYKLFDKGGNLVSSNNLQNKEPWYNPGKSPEEVFVDKYGQALGLQVNPEKKTNKYAIELLHANTKKLCGLKIRNSPLFFAFEKYSIDPQYGVSISQRDYLKYLKFYHDIEIYFWISWLITRVEGKKIIEVKPIEGIWKISLDGLNEIIKTAPLHYYQKHMSSHDGSYILDLTNSHFVQVI